jgi:hypothetical protein
MTLYARVDTWAVVAIVLTSMVGDVGRSVPTARAAAANPENKMQEPNAAVACSWFPDLTKQADAPVWTPVGWKDHTWLFNVLHDGSITPSGTTDHTSLFKVLEDGSITPLRHDLTFPLAVSKCGRLVIGPSSAGRSAPVAPSRQGWVDCHAPLLWTEWRNDGCQLRYEFFAHLLGGREAARGDEPLFGRLRLSIRPTQAAPPPSKIGFALIGRSDAKLPAVPEGALPTDGWQLTDGTGKVILGIPGGQKGTFALLPDRPKQKDFTLVVSPAIQPGSHVDLIFPAPETERAVYDREAQLGYDDALQEANAFWSRIPATAARVDTPEPFVNQVLRQALKYREMITTRDVSTGDYCMIAGSYRYRGCWAETMAREAVWVLEWMGYHSVNEKYLRAFLRAQGTVVAPGKAYPPHPGYLAAPRFVRGVDWLTDHGALLYDIGSHALLTGDAQFIRNHTDAVVKACDFLKDARLLRHDGVQGLLPAARADDSTVAQAIWTNAWNYKGLVTAVRLLRRINHPRAEEFAREAEAYREVIARAIRNASASVPPFQHNGRTIPFVPRCVSPKRALEDRAPFNWFDTGATSLVFAGVLPPNDPIIQADMEYAYLKGMLRHEACVSEPDYSWNLFRWHVAGDRARFIEAMYGILAYSVSRQTFIATEGADCGWVTGVVRPIASVACAARLAVVDDQIQNDELHLLRLCPLAWLRPDYLTRFENMPTEFGPVTLKFKLGANAKTLDLTYEPKYRQQPKRVVLHIPPVAGLDRITLNGKTLDWDRRERMVVLE